MAISIPIVTEFDGKGISKAVQQFKQLETTGQKAQFAIKKAAIPAAAAVAGLTVAMGDAVKAAIDDEKSQQMLARQLKATTGATDDQIKSVEKYISAQGKNLGITDDQLRPALAGLVRVTKDVNEAQNAASLAMDIAAGKGISLQTATNALEKAYGGNFKALGMLAPEVRQMIKDGASLEEVFAELQGSFGGAAAEASKTAAGGFAKMKLALDETKESIGAALLPVIEKALPYLQKMADWAQDNPKAFTIIAGTITSIALAIMAVNTAMALNPFGLIAVGIGVAITAFTAAYTKFEGFRNFINGFVNTVAGNFEFVANAFIKAINVIIRGINLVKPGKDLPTLGYVSIGRIGGASSTGAASSGDFRKAEETLSAGLGSGIAPDLGAGYAAASAPKKGAGSGVKVPTGPDGWVGVGLGEVPIMLSESQIDPSIRQPVATNVEINVNGGDPNAVVDALRQYMRQNGTIPIKVSM